MGFREATKLFFLSKRNILFLPFKRLYPSTRWCYHERHQWPGHHGRFYARLCCITVHCIPCTMYRFIIVITSNIRQVEHVQSPGSLSRKWYGRANKATLHFTDDYTMGLRKARNMSAASSYGLRRNCTINRVNINIKVSASVSMHILNPEFK